MALPKRRPKGHRISLKEAVEMTRRYREGMHKGGMFLAEDVGALLRQPKVAGIRFYYGLGKNGEDTLILVGVDAKGNDMLDGDLLENHFPCPIFCGSGNQLNS